VAGSYEHGTEPSGSIKCGEFLDQLSVLLAFQEGLCSMEIVNVLKGNISRHSIMDTVGICLPEANKEFSIFSVSNALTSGGRTKSWKYLRCERIIIFECGQVRRILHDPDLSYGGLCSFRKFRFEFTRVLRVANIQCSQSLLTQSISQSGLVTYLSFWDNGKDLENHAF
jgi:hypothetical protein